MFEMTVNLTKSRWHCDPDKLT